MKLVLLTCLAAVALARPDGDAETISDQRTGPLEDGSYSLAFQTSNQIAVEEQGAPGGNGQVNSQGRYSYTDNDGNTFEITFIADENGFQPQGAHLPVAPQAPPHVAELLRIAEELKASGVVFDEQGRRVN